MVPEQLFHALSDGTRLRALTLLRAEGELCVCELTHALELAQPKVSRHLALLRDAGVVSDRRSARWIYYRLAPDLPAWAHAALGAAAQGAGAQLAEDRERLQHMPGRPEVGRCA